jgi:hypothetical protein
MHRACHLAMKAVALRRHFGEDADMEEQIQKSVQSLREHHRQWSCREVVMTAEAIEQSGQLGDVPTLTDAFLSHPPLNVTNPFYANLLNHFRAVEIVVSLIARPIWSPPDRNRFSCAVDICRTHAALGHQPNKVSAGAMWQIYFAGVAFAGPEVYPVTMPKRD